MQITPVSDVSVAPAPHKRKQDSIVQNSGRAREIVQQALDMVYKAQQKDEKLWVLIVASSEHLGSCLVRAFMGHFVYEDPEKYAEASRFVWVRWPGRTFSEEEKKELSSLEEDLQGLWRQELLYI